MFIMWKGRTVSGDVPPVWIDRFICQYQMADTTCCSESILNANRSQRWGQSLTAGGHDPYSRDSEQLRYSFDSPPVEHEPILAFSQECLGHYTTEHKNAGNVPRFGAIEGYNILRYKTGEAYHAVHPDWGWPHLAHRHLTFTMFLNTCPSGGELEFPSHNIRVDPVGGRAVIFPPQWMYSHRSLQTTVDRYVFNIFYGFLPSEEE